MCTDTSWIWANSIIILGPWCPLAWHKWAICESLLCENRFHHFAKVFSLKVSHYTYGSWQILQQTTKTVGMVAEVVSVKGHAQTTLQRFKTCVTMSATLSDSKQSQTMLLFMIYLLWHKHNVVLAQAFWTISQVNQQYVAHSCFPLLAQGGQSGGKYGSVCKACGKLGGPGACSAGNVEKIFTFAMAWKCFCYISEVSGFRFST